MIFYPINEKKRGMSFFSVNSLMIGLQKKPSCKDDFVFC